MSEYKGIKHELRRVKKLYLVILTDYNMGYFLEKKTVPKESEIADLFETRIIPNLKHLK